MNFGERLRSMRKQAGLTQQALAKQAGITDRTIQNYENGRRNPQRFTNVKALADVLGVSSHELMGEEGMLVANAAERGGYKAKKDIQELVDEVKAVFAGGDLTEEDRDAAMRALTEAYWIAKDKNKKYAPKGQHKK